MCNKLTVAVVFGGQSSEHDVSCVSGATIMKALNPEKYEMILIGITKEGRWLLADSIKDVESGAWENSRTQAIISPDAGDGGIIFSEGERVWKKKVDVIFPVLHGMYGEDGTIQGVLEWMQIPYTGSGVLASAIGIDKQATCNLWENAGLPVPEGFQVSAPSEAAEIIRRLGRSLVVKPNKDGSSFGVEKLEDATEETLADAIRRSLAVEDDLVVERRIHGREFTCAVLGEGKNAKALPIIEIMAPNGDYNSVNKYQGNEVRYACPADLPEETARAMAETVEKAYRVIGARGWGRIDLMMEPSGRFYLLEINTNPGMTPHSLVPMAARAVGIPYEELVLQVASEARLDHAV